jgi:hypothetical protein
MALWRWRSRLRGLLTGALVMVIVPAGFLLMSLLIWPALIGLQRLSDGLFVPYASGSYRMMSGLSQLGVVDFPININAFTVLSDLRVKPRRSGRGCKRGRRSRPYTCP